jgi:hypothetical protein
MPLVSDIQADIEIKMQAIADIKSQIIARAGELKGLENFKKLLYASGGELESLFSNCIERCGGTIAAARYSDEEFVCAFR